MLQLLWQILSDDGIILTPLFLLDRILFTVLGWDGSQSRCFLLAWPEMIHLHDEGLVALSQLMATILSVGGGGAVAM